MESCSGFKIKFKTKMLQHHRLFCSSTTERSRMHACKTVFIENDVNFVFIDGSVPSKNRQALVERFQTGKVQWALLSMQAAGTGLNLFRAARVVFTELVFSDSIHLQSERRALRKGNLNDKVTILYLICKGSTDSILWRSVLKKQRTASALVDNSESSFRLTNGKNKRNKINIHT